MFGLGANLRGAAKIACLGREKVMVVVKVILRFGGQLPRGGMCLNPSSPERVPFNLIAVIQECYWDSS